MEIKDIIRESRKKRGLTLKELSQNSGVSLSFISDIENGRRLPSTEKSKRIADTLNIDFRLLLNKGVVSILNEITADIESITDPNIRSIIRASKYLSDAECIELRNLAERLFPQAFKDMI